MANKFFDPQVKIGWVLSLLLVILVKGMQAYYHDIAQDAQLATMDADRAHLRLQIDALRDRPCLTK